MAEVSRVLVPGGIVALVVDDIHNFKGSKGNNVFTQIELVGKRYQTYLRKGRIYLTDQITWIKGENAYRSQNVSKRYTDETAHTGYKVIPCHEPVYIFRKKGDRDIPSEEIVTNSLVSKEEWGLWAQSVWEIDHVENPEGHPAMFPDELVLRLVRMFSYQGDIVLDPFLGSGTTVKVARELDRDAIGYELDEQYKSIIMEKLGLADGSHKAESMVEHAKRSMGEKPPELAVPKEKAPVKTEFFTNEGFSFD